MVAGMVQSGALQSPSASKVLPPLENGDRLTAGEFLRRFDAMPNLKKAELIQGLVHMPSPVRADQHGDPDSIAQTWLGTYAVATPGVISSTNITIRLSRDDVAQPDAALRLSPERGGQSRVSAEGYLVGPPELVFEVAASSASVDANDKKTTYRLAGVREYIVWRTLDQAIDWWRLVEDDYHAHAPGDDGIFRSLAFPGLWLDGKALIARNGARVIEILNQGIGSAEHARFISTP